MNIQEFQEKGENILKIENSAGESIKINASAGAGLISFQKKIDNQLFELIEIPLIENQGFKGNPFHPSSFLFPYQNRVRNGNYSFLGKNYQLAINEDNLNNAIHGFIDFQEFKVIDKRLGNNWLAIDLAYSYTGDIQGYPFPFDFQVSYHFQEIGNLILEFTIKNTGKTKMPFSFGWHPYFRWKDCSPENLGIEFKPKEKFLSDSQMIPLKGIDLENQTFYDLGKEPLDNIFSLNKSGENHEISLFEIKNPNKKMTLEFPAQDFNYACVFIPQGFHSVAIEPLTGNTDCFNTEEGLKILDPNDLFKTKIICKFNL